MRGRRQGQWYSLLVGLHQPRPPLKFRPLVFPRRWLKSPHAQPKPLPTARVVLRKLQGRLDALPLPELPLRQQVLQPEPLVRRAGQ